MKKIRIINKIFRLIFISPKKILLLIMSTHDYTCLIELRAGDDGQPQPQQEKLQGQPQAQPQGWPDAYEVRRRPHQSTFPAH
jgi:hypothetical protein